MKTITTTKMIFGIEMNIIERENLIRILNYFMNDEETRDRHCDREDAEFLKQFITHVSGH